MVPYASCHRLAGVTRASRSIHTSRTLKTSAVVCKRNADFISSNACTLREIEIETERERPIFSE